MLEKNHNFSYFLPILYKHQNQYIYTESVVTTKLYTFIQPLFNQLETTCLQLNMLIHFWEQVVGLQKYSFEKKNEQYGL